MLFCHASQIDLEVGQRWHVLFATTAVFHGGSCYFSVCFHLVWIAAAGFLNKISTRKSTGFDVPQRTVHTGAQNIYKGLVQSYD